MRLVPLATLALCACLVVPASNAPAPPASGRVFRVATDGCPAGARLVTFDEARADPDAMCALLDEWDIARLEGGGSLDGPGYGCTLSADDPRRLGHALCSR